MIRPGVDDSPGWIDGAPQAKSRFEAKLERRKVSRSRRIGAVIADMAGGLIDAAATSSPGGQLFDTSPYRHRIQVVDRTTGTVVHSQDWKGDEPGARRSLAHIERDLEGMNVAGFCDEYNITLGSRDP